MYRFLSRNTGAWGFQNQVFAWKGLQKQTFHRNRFLEIAVSIFFDFLCFSEALGATFLIFVALEKGLEIDGFSEENLIQSTEVGGGNLRGIGRPKPLLQTCKRQLQDR